MTTTTGVKSTVQALAEVAELRCRSYSGRGMYGRTCLAVTFDDGPGELFSALLTVLAETGTTQEACAELADAFRGMRTDSMGRGMVAYFPEIEYVATPAEPCPAGTRCDACNPGTCDCVCHEKGEA